MNHKAKIIPNIVLPGILTISGVVGIIAIATATTTSALTYSSDTDVSFTFSPTLSISLSNANINIDNLLPGLSSESSPITVHVNSNTPYGYSLFASVGNSTDYNTTNLVHESNDNNNSIPSTFTSIATNASLPQLDTDNTWGYSFSNDNGTTWSNYNGLPLYSTVGNNTSTNNPALLIDTKSPADSTESIDFKIAAKASATQASGTYNNVINFYAVGKPEPPRYLYDEVAKMSKGPQTIEDLQATISAPTSTDYREDTSNSGVFLYDSSIYGESSDAGNNYNIYYYRGILEPTNEQSTYGSGSESTTYPNYVKLSNDTCWRIVRTTGSGGVKMIYNGAWDSIDSTCANIEADTQIEGSGYASQGTSAQGSYWNRNIHYVGYTFNNNMTDKTTKNSVDTVFGSNSNYSTTNRSDSKIKTIIEKWFEDNMAEYGALVEPSAGYCNDRSAYSNKHSIITTIIPWKSFTKVNFGASERANVISLTCPANRNVVDLYTTEASANGNKQMRYPAALLTADEMKMASPVVQDTENGYRSYLMNNSDYYSMSPSHNTDSYSIPYMYGISKSYLNNLGSSGLTSGGIRPVISLKPGATATSGSGTATDPWIVSAP